MITFSTDRRKACRDGHYQPLPRLLPPRLLPDPKLIAENKAAVYLITEDPNMPLPPMENEEIIYPLAREMSREEQMGLLFKAMDKLGIQSQRQKESKNKSKSKSKGQHSRRKK